jgi:predicted nucleic acid-binding Zn ribbon protein
MDRISGRSLAARLFGASPARTLALLHAAWPLAVGPELARRTEVLGLEGGTLRLRVPDARWRKALHRMQPQILAQLRELAGDLAPRRMGFTEGQIADPEIRERFVAAAARYLARSKDSKGRTDA